SQTTIATSTPRSVVLADINGDGKPDLLVGNQTAGTVSVFLGNGNGTFQSAATFTVGSAPRPLTVADANADGRPDVVVPNGGTSVSVLLNTANGNFTGQVYTIDP